MKEPLTADLWLNDPHTPQSDAETAFERAILDLDSRTVTHDENGLYVAVFNQALDVVIHWARLYRHAINLTYPLMKKYEGEGEGGIAEFNIAMEALKRALGMHE